MQNKISFGKWESVALLINLICTKVFLYFPRMVVEDAGSAGWIMTIYICLLAFILMFFLNRLYGKFEGKDIIDITEIAGGRILKLITGLIISGALLALTVNVIREFSEEMKVVSLTLSPLSYIMIFFIIGMVIGSFLGIESIVRYNAIMVPVIAVGYILILLGAVPEIEITNIYPILGYGADEAFIKGFSRVSVFGELMVIFLLPPFTGSNKELRRAGWLALGFSSVFLTAGSLMYILTFPYPSILESFLPLFQMARLINLGRFFQRIEALFVLTWAMAALMYLTSTFYFSIYSFAKTAGLKYMRPLILPFAIIVFSLAFIPPNLISVIKIETEIINRMLWLVTFVIAGLILIIANLRNNPGRGGCK